ncbi:hypothetical protein ACVWWG_007026 [Bradyrhizobium sp. LB7.2]
MAGIEEERGVAGLDRPIEREQRLGKLLPALVLGDHHREAELFQRVTHGAGVVDRLEQLWNVPVVVVADDERDALLGIGGKREAAEAGRETKQCQNSEKLTRHRKSFKNGPRRLPRTTVHWNPAVDVIVGPAIPPVQQP